MPTPHPPRPRSAEATRKAILIAARHAFARAGYDGAGLREIAAGAGVTAMMVNRYFGSKEELFAEVVAGIMTKPIIFVSDSLATRGLAEALTAGVVQRARSGATPLDGLLIMMHSASSSRATAIARSQMERHYSRQLADALPGDLAEQRAATILAIVAGIQVMREVIGLSALADARPEDLSAILKPVFEQLVGRDKTDSPAPRRPSKTKRIGLPPR
jgi:AcrR family transcriptional regulator